MTDKTTEVLRLREASKVKRCHTTPYHGDYSLGQHSVDMLYLLDALHPGPSLRLYRAILYHDLHERWSGDLPATIRFVDPELKRKHRSSAELLERTLDFPCCGLDGKDSLWLWALDKLELLLWCHDQINMGNNHVQVMMRDVDDWMKSRYDDLPAEVVKFHTNFKWRRTDERDLL